MMSKIIENLALLYYPTKKLSLRAQTNNIWGQFVMFERLPNLTGQLDRRDVKSDLFLSRRGSKNIVLWYS